MLLLHEADYEFHYRVLLLDMRRMPTFRQHDFLDFTAVGLVGWMKYYHEQAQVEYFPFLLADRLYSGGRFPHVAE